MKKVIMTGEKGTGAFEVSNEYFVEETPLGNVGALFRMRDKLNGDFSLINTESIFDIDLWVTTKTKVV